MNPLDDRLKHHVTGAIERGEGVAVAAIENPRELPAGYRILGEREAISKTCLWQWRDGDQWLPVGNRFALLPVATLRVRHGQDALLFALRRTNR